MIPADSERYFRLIEATLRDALSGPLGESGESDEATFPLSAALPTIAARFGFSTVAPSNLNHAAAKLTTAVRFVDGAGHHRPAYAALAVRAFLRDGRSSGEHILDRFAALNIAGVETLASLPLLAANDGARIVGNVFAAWAMLTKVASTKKRESSAMKLAVAALANVAAAQQPNGTFLARDAADSLEPQWYDELAILHALSCYASESGDEQIAAAVHRAVRYHAAETQPDHASSHPWAIAAFLGEPEAIPLADMMLHAAGVQSSRTMDAVSLLLLADALDCGKRRATR